MKKLYTVLFAILAIFLLSPQKAGAQQNEYFCIQGYNASASLIVKKVGTPNVVQLQYSTDKSNWTDVTYDVAMTIGKTNHYFRGVNSSGLSKDLSNYVQFYINYSTSYTIAGNVMSLIYGDNFSSQTTILGDYCFCYLLMGGSSSSSTISSLVLPATTLTRGCYYGMFKDHKIASAPALPAVNLEPQCYAQMFYNWAYGSWPTTLNITLPAEELVDSCYYEMFVQSTASSTNNKTRNVKIMATSLKNRFGTNIVNPLAKMFQYTGSTTIGNSLTNNIYIYFTDWCSSSNTATTNPTYNWFGGYYGNVAARLYFHYDSNLPTTSTYKQTAAANGTITSFLPKNHTLTAETNQYLTFDVATNGGTWEKTGNYNANIRRVIDTSNGFPKTIPAAPVHSTKVFAGWFTSASGSGTALTEEQLKAYTTSTTVYARFVEGESKFLVTVNSPENGTILVYDKADNNKTSLNNTQVNSGTILKLECTADATYRLKNWTGDAATLGTEFTLDKAVTIGATFEKDSCLITFANSTPDGYGSISISDGTNNYTEGQTYTFNRQTDNGKVLTITTNPASERLFDSWVDANSLLTQTSTNPYTATYTIGASTPNAVTFGAKFKVKLYTINATSTNGTVQMTASGYANVNNQGQYEKNTEVSLLAQENKYYKFVKWSDDVTTNPRFITVTNDLTLSAIFESDPSSNTGYATVYQDGTGKHTGNMKKILYGLDPTTGTDGITYTPVDMGYGVAWADRNIGASSTTAVGYRFYWGGLVNITSYPSSAYYSGIDNITNRQLPLEADAAYQTMGDNTWRVPTKDELGALLSSTNTNLSTNITYTGNDAAGDGVITSKVDAANTITIPQSGVVRFGTESSVVMGTQRCYWTATLSADPSGGTTCPYSYYSYAQFYAKEYTDLNCKSLMPIRAIYSPEFETRTLTIQTQNGGTTNTYVYVCELGQQITITATPATGYVFSKWSEDNNTDAIRTFTVTENATYTATFAQEVKYTITINTPTNGTLTVKDGDKTINSGDQVLENHTLTVTTTPATGYHFDAWTNDGAASVTVDNNKTIGATFAINTYTITWNNYDGSLLETDENVEYGQTPSYDGATPSKAEDAENTYEFKDWGGELKTVTKDTTYIATFTATPKSTIFELVDDKNSGDTYYTTLSGLVGEAKDVRYVRTFAAGTAAAPSWSIFSLPFNYFIDEEGQTFYGKVLDLDNAEYNDGVVTLNFVYETFQIEANKPYVLYNTGDAIENPEFANVTFAAQEVNSYDVDCTPSGTVTFYNTLCRQQLTANDVTTVFITNNQLYHPGSSTYMRAFRGYFKLNDILPSSAPRRIELRIDETTGLSTEMQPNTTTQKYFENGILIIERNGVRYNAQGTEIK